MIWKKISDIKSDSLQLGDILSCKATYPYEDRVEMMLFDNLDKNRGMGLICTTGIKSGKIAVVLPIESTFNGKNVSVEWLIQNWNHWIFLDSDINEVFVSKGYSLTNLVLD
ncbi:Imm45 family immunity protein [Marinomonas colpomeniae]|uniref:Immunity protein 45 domain-containing protein n=1 Tax=Marinomonas colpomeniae TaxID=2774408 RepID=A0ABR8P2K1_9GAMM|nr:Imm45 family immunity protein [Marinomonas colpomeniae]MBD5772105.1 hypothetical protein [Marinomonas colpomeniae]